MDILIRYGFSIEEIKCMMDCNQDIGNIEDNDIEELINILKDNNCNLSIIKNILLTNPFYLNNNIDDVLRLIDTLKKNNVNDLDLLFDSNPFILNISSKDIKRILNKLDNKLFYYNSSNII